MANPALLLRRLPLAPVVAVMFGATAAALVAATPQWMLESASSSTGLSALAIARPPLGMTARLLFVLAAFVLVAAFTVAVVTLIGRAIASLTARRQRDVNLATFAEELPKEGGRRRPISADRELGAPLMSDEALATLQEVAPVEPQPVLSEQADLEQVEPEQVEPEPEQVEPSSVAPTAAYTLVPSDAAPEAEADVVPETLEDTEPVEEAPLVLEAPEPVEASPQQPETQTVEDLMVDDELLLDAPLYPKRRPRLQSASL